MILVGIVENGKQITEHTNKSFSVWQVSVSRFAVVDDFLGRTVDKVDVEDSPTEACEEAESLAVDFSLEILKPF